MRKARVHKRHKAFDFAASSKVRNEAWQRRMAGFEGLVMTAAKGDPEPLIDYFERSGPFQLSEQDGVLLAWLLRSKLPRAAHRPRGSFTPTNQALRRASYLLRFGKRVWCEARPRPGLQKGSDRQPG